MSRVKKIAAKIARAAERRKEISGGSLDSGRGSLLIRVRQRVIADWRIQMRDPPTPRLWRGKMFFEKSQLPQYENYLLVFIFGS